MELKSPPVVEVKENTPNQVARVWEKWRPTIPAVPITLAREHLQGGRLALSQAKELGRLIHPLMRFPLPQNPHL